MFISSLSYYRPTSVPHISITWNKWNRACKSHACSSIEMRGQLSLRYQFWTDGLPWGAISPFQLKIRNSDCLNRHAKTHRWVFVCVHVGLSLLFLFSFQSLPSLANSLWLHWVDPSKAAEELTGSRSSKFQNNVGGCTPVSERSLDLPSPGRCPVPLRHPRPTLTPHIVWRLNPANGIISPRGQFSRMEKQHLTESSAPITALLVDPLLPLISLWTSQEKNQMIIEWGLPKGIKFILLFLSPSFMSLEKINYTFNCNLLSSLSWWNCQGGVETTHTNTYLQCEGLFLKRTYKVFKKMHVVCLWVSVLSYSTHLLANRCKY